MAVVTNFFRYIADANSLWRRRLISIQIIVFVVAAAPISNSRELVIDGFGKEHCKDLINAIDANKNGNDAVYLGLWAMGYLSGVARHSNDLARLSPNEFESVGFWLGNYCVDHPKTSLIDALDVYIKSHPKR